MSCLTVIRDAGSPYAACPSCGEHFELTTVGARWRARSPREVADRLVVQLGGLEREELHVLLLDVKCFVVAQERVYQGNVSASLVRIGELFREAVHRNASAILLVHNHPSGDVDPSPDDLHLTTEAVAAGRLLNVPVFDHLIVGGTDYLSFRERGLLGDDPRRHAASREGSPDGPLAPGDLPRRAGPPWLADTRHGYPLDEVVSALQKCIRRGMTDEALFWAVEMNESGYGAYAWRRMMVIASEDIGLADNNAIVMVMALYRASEIMREARKGNAEVKRGQPWNEESILHAVAYLARTSKNRDMADAYSTIKVRMERGQLLEIPDVAIDQHTTRGRRRGRGEEHFQTEGRRVHGGVSIPGSQWGASWEAERPHDDGDAS